MVSRGHTPYALRLAGDPQVRLAAVVRWLERIDDDGRLQWKVNDLETTGPDDDALELAIASTASLGRLLERQVIELNVIATRDDSLTYWIVVRDGAIVILLGKGDVPTPFEIGGLYDIIDPARYYWE